MELVLDSDDNPSMFFIDSFVRLGECSVDDFWNPYVDGWVFVVPG